MVEWASVVTSSDTAPSPSLVLDRPPGGEPSQEGGGLSELSAAHNFGLNAKPGPPLAMPAILVSTVCGARWGLARLSMT